MKRCYTLTVYITVCNINTSFILRRYISIDELSCKYCSTCRLVNEIENWWHFQFRSLEVVTTYLLEKIIDSLCKYTIFMCEYAII